MKLITSSISTIAIVGINHENQALSVLVVMSPQRPDLVLSSDIPHGEADILILDCLHVESNSRDGCNHLA